MSNVIAPKHAGGAGLVVTIEKWRYSESIARVTPLVLNWKNLTVELARELYLAREALNSQRGQRKDPDADDYIEYTWSDYCDEIGLSKRTANSWLACFVPAELSDTGRDLLLDKRPSDPDADRAAEARSAREERIAQFRSTGVRPDGWLPEDEVELHKRLTNERIHKLASDLTGKRSTLKPRKDYLAEVVAHTRGRKYKLSPDQQIMEADLNNAIRAYLLTFGDTTLRLKVAYNLTTNLRDIVNELTEFDIRATDEEEAS